MRHLPLVLLAPSEAKAPGGEPGRLSENPAQAWVRRQLKALVRHGTPSDQAKAFEVKEPALLVAKAEALALGGVVPLLPALERYTGVAFQALHPAGMDRDMWSRVWLLSALRGLERGDWLVPPYKLKLGSFPGLREHWRSHLPTVASALPPGVLWDLLPADHSNLLREWQRPRHTLEIRNARGAAVSHASKKYRGLVAGWILRERQGDPEKVLKSRIEGGVWTSLDDNGFGGMKLRLEVS
jgi:cytoplasmic iron level regulating protein YaaA (DUF328/UPF0246 family)